MSGKFLDGPCGRPTHRQMRAERVAEDVDADVPEVRAPRGARDQPLNIPLRQRRRRRLSKRTRGPFR